MSYNMYRINDAITYVGGVTMSIINATTARNNFFKIMEDVIVTNEPVYVTGKAGNIVVISEEDYRSIQETLYLISIPGMREKILRGLNTPLEDLVEDDDE